MWTLWSGAGWRPGPEVPLLTCGAERESVLNSLAVRQLLNNVQAAALVRSWRDRSSRASFASEDLLGQVGQARGGGWARGVRGRGFGRLG